MSKVTELIELFVSEVAPSTAKDYAGKILHWYMFCGSDETLLNATELDARRYLNQLKTQKGLRCRATGDDRLSPRTISEKLSTIIRFHKFLVNSKISEANPWVNIRFKRRGRVGEFKRPHELIPRAKVKEICDLPPNCTKLGIRDRAILALLFGAGLRRGELSKLLLTDVRITPRGTTYIRLRRTKSGQDCDQALPTWASERVARLVEQRVKEGAEPGAYLLTHYSAVNEIPSENYPSYQIIYRVFKLYCGRAGLPSYFSPHAARVAAITRLLEEGLTHREVQEFSRHASVAMVEIYDRKYCSVDDHPGLKLDYEKKV